MRLRLAIGAMLTLAACATAGSAVVIPIAPLSASGGISRETLVALNAVCGAEEKAGTFSHDLKLAAGMGTGGFEVDTKIKDAQDWFDYGLALSHAFYHEDAKGAMRRSVAADPNCSLCEWGLAWTLGPTLNYGIGEKDRIEALAAAEKAKALAKPGDARGAALAAAIVARYAPAAAVSGPKNALGAVRAGESGTEHDFGQAMAKISASYPNDTELAVLAAHSLLIPVRGKDERGLKQALRLLEGVLKTHPDDTAAIHYYIHATEFDKRAEDALPYAERLGLLAPAASHLVHMPAHTLFHAGRYEDAAVVNAKAIEADSDWLRAGGNPVAPGAPATAPPMYYSHNLAFGLAGALMSGDSELALKYASHAQRIWPNASKSGTPIPRTYVALARYAPDEALAIPEIKSEDPKFAIYRHYARGEAFLLKGDGASARAELKALTSIQGAGAALEFEVARDVLNGRIAMAEGRPKDAASIFAAAAKVQDDKLVGYMDPPTWWYPVRRSVAAAQLKAGNFVAAEAEARKSLAAWKRDPLALWVLAKAEEGQSKSAAAAADLAEAKRLWRGGFESITVDAI